MPNMKLFHPSTLLIACLSLPHAASATPPTPDAAFASTWLEAAYLPRHQALGAAVQQLLPATEALCQHLDDTTLAQARERWRDAQLAWRRMDGGAGYPNIIARTARMIDFRPVRTKDIETRVAEGQATDASNVAVRGLAAVEYLLYGDAQPQAQLARLAEPNRCARLESTARQLSADMAKTDDAWTDYLRQVSGTDDNARRNLLALNIGQILSGLDGAVRRIPRIKSPQPDAWLDWRSGLSQAAIGAQLDGARQAWFGHLGGTDAPAQPASMDGLLRAQGHVEGADRIKLAFEQVRSRHAALANDLSRVDGAHAQAIADFQLAVAALRRHIEQDGAVALGIVLGFNDNDGD